MASSTAGDKLIKEQFLAAEGEREREEKFRVLVIKADEGFFY